MRCGGFFDGKKAREKVRQMIDEYNLQVAPDAKVENISVGMQQRVKIGKALDRGADMLIRDEPTAVLTPQEIDRRIQVMRDLTSSGKTIIIITHKLKEIKASSNTCTIIRRGQYVDEVAVADVTEEDLADMMVGHHVNLQVEKQPATPGKTVFEIRDLHVNDERGIETVKGLDLAVRSGEIVGIAGIDGNGQGARRGHHLPDQGHLRRLVNGEEVPKTPRRATSSTTRSRPSMRTARSAAWCCPSPLPRTPRSRSTARPSSATRACSTAQRCTNTPSSSSPTTMSAPPTAPTKPPAACPAETSRRSSSPARSPTIPTCSSPCSPRAASTWAPSNVHKALVAERDRGTAILLISLELDEVMSVSDTIDVIYDGRITGTFKQGEVDENKVIGLLMAA